ncbi:hypothetical protein Sme01_11490 [Sphaerisporangium melleum]|uniref:Uncharacterized protein n=1 Tax=Sphaerisporangium melleum TaxID=321316 RepID=A0A917RGY0_9ACTN|nr:hypothetical protein GCM10007964_57290 [Sphaerisporangium melleum]GII68673.1 hypothetical protein Sme01_11490 [Sphaerisporangium melleum]
MIQFTADDTGGIPFPNFPHIAAGAESGGPVRCPRLSPRPGPAPAILNHTLTGKPP